ncbi:MAG: SDR family NAD(P)-dependent oxidoreductase [Sphingobacteriales bacterium]|nr:SDR family NAD(P)-dependent oxidoreductase [Sphingobacteriales bacterium]
MQINTHHAKKRIYKRHCYHYSAASGIGQQLCLPSCTGASTRVIVPIQTNKDCKKPKLGKSPKSQHPNTPQSAYCTAKFGVRGFTETLRMELAGTNIHTTCVHPGGVKTNIAKNAPVKGSFITNEMQKKGVESFEKVAQTTAHKAAQLILDAIEKRKNAWLLV